MKTRTSIPTTCLTGVLSVALLVNNGCVTLEEVTKQAKRVIQDSSSSILPSVAAGAAGFFGAKHLMKANNGQSVLVALIASTTVFFVVKAATNAEKREAEARARELRDRRERERTAAATTSGSTESINSSDRYVALELPPTPQPAGPNASAPGTISNQPPPTGVTDPSHTPDASASPTANPQASSRFVIVDVVSGEVIGDEVYEAASRPRNEEKIQVGERELTYVQYNPAGAGTPASPAPTN